jgi:hypothetical protein
LAGIIRALRQSTLNYHIVADVQQERERANFVVGLLTSDHSIDISAFYSFP